jgi:hypothetical protein
MNEKWNRLSKPAKLLIIAPLAILGMALFILISGTIVMLLWNALLPSLFSLPVISFWQALGILLLCRILFGGVGMRGRRRFGSRRRHGKPIAD